MRKQLALLKKESASYGGVLRNTRAGRSKARVLGVKHTMHLVLRSSKAKGLWSFARPEHRNRIRTIILKHAGRQHIQIISLANVGNHLHLHLKLPSRQAYFPFIRAITGAIALVVTKASKLAPIVKAHKDRFWDHRPFSTLITSFRHRLNMKDYMRVNELEGYGYPRITARSIIAQEHDGTDIASVLAGTAVLRGPDD